MLKKLFNETMQEMLEVEMDMILGYRDYWYAYTLVLEYVEIFYDTVRIYSNCDYISLDEYKKMYQ
ncbi:hypothetical protein [Pectinatus frisingensis]|uniref:hypothetical protein n=1 Tax=Pectinatus frisingensis TaxID=865 RepID=UPI0018C5E7A8|nr:hypothetical protein [Pectinatus frisingensis]